MTGFAGSGASRAAILIAGIAGMLAGAFSIATREYLTISQRQEKRQQEIALEAQEIAEKPEEERAELVLIYRAKGLDRSDAERLADRMMTNPDIALDTLAREELGLEPGELRSPWMSALSTYLAFALGAFVPIPPYLVVGGTMALLTALGLAVIAMFVVGARIGALNGRSTLRCGTRQVIAGSFVAAVTFGIGHAIGIGIAMC